jgi:hypothetical protein
MVSQTRTGAIPEAESQQNADGLDASLDCRRSALSELGVGLRHIVAVRTTPAQRSPTALRRSTPNDGFNSYLDALRSPQSPCFHIVKLNEALEVVAAAGSLRAAQ